MYQGGFNPFIGGYSSGAVARGGLFSRLFSGLSKFNFSNFLGTTQKTLGVINQAIPVFYQVKPIWNNAKTMFRVMGAMKSDDTTTNSNTVNSTLNRNTLTSSSTTPVSPLTISEQPQFFL